MSSATFSVYLFDLDGTLVDSRVDLAHAVNRARQSLDLPTLPLETVASYVGEGVAKLMDRAMAQEHAVGLTNAEGLARADLLAEATRRFRAHYAAHLLDNTRAYDGVHALLQGLRDDGARLAVVTNKPEDYSRAILSGLGLQHFFEIVIGGDTLPERKPHPLPIAHAMSRMEARSGESLMVGDSRIDVLCARAAGIPVCAVTYGIGAREELVALNPDFLADHPLQVRAAVPIP